MLAYGSNVAWSGQKLSSEILNKAGTWVAFPIDNLGPNGTKRYTVFALSFEDMSNNKPSIAPFPDDYAWEFYWNYNQKNYMTKDNVSVNVWEAQTGSMAFLDVEKFCNHVVYEQISFEDWLATQTKADIDNIIAFSKIRYDIYLEGTNKPAITTHFENSGSTPLTFDFVVSPFGSDTIDEEYKNTSWENGISNLNKDVSLKLALSSADNKGGWYKSWVDLDNETFNKWNKAMKVIHNGFSTNYSSSDYYVIASRVRNETTAETIKVSMCTW